MKHKLPKYVRRKRAKDKTYYYFDMGGGVLKPLPDVSDMAFGRALAAAIAVRNRKARPEPSHMTVSKMADLWEKSPAFRALAEGTRTSYHHYLPAIRQEIGDAPVNDVRRQDVYAYLMHPRGETPAAANQIVRVLGALYAWGRKTELTTAKPTAEVEFLPIGEHLPWPEWLVEEALASDDELVSLSTHLLYFTAQRLGDMLRMRWTDIRAGRVMVTQEKTETPLAIAIHPRLAARLEQVQRQGLTILSRGDHRPHRAETVRKALQAFAKERGVKVVPHGLRKNAVNALLEAGCSTYEVQAVSGQSPQVIEHYAKHRDKTRLGDAAILRWNKAGK